MNEPFQPRPQRHLEPQAPVAVRKDKTVSLRLYLSTVIFMCSLLALLMAGNVALLSLLFRTPTTATPVVQAATMAPSPTSSPTPTLTPTPAPTSTPLIQVSIASQPITTTMFGWFDSQPLDYSFYCSKCGLRVGQSYALCWSGGVIDGASLSSPKQQVDLSQSAGGACLVARLATDQRNYKIGFISQAVRHGFIGNLEKWPIMELHVFELPVGNQTLPYPLLKAVLGDQ